MTTTNSNSSPKPWMEMAATLVDVATGRKPADLIIRNGKWVNVYSGEIIPGIDVAIVGGRFAYVGENADHCVGNDTKLVDADGRYLVPGLCDAHMHVESGMVTVTEFTRAVIPHGTTSMFIDPHEIANVLGLDGVRLMHDEAAAMPINVHVQMPSCVPSAPGLEIGGAELGPDDIAEAMTWPNIIGLGEVMDFPGVAANTPRMTGEIAATMATGKTVGGHYASPDLGPEFHGYVAGGPEDDHEGTRAIDAVSRVRQGMRSMLRLGSAWYDVAEQVKAITAIQMATLNTAQHFRLDREVGSIAPGRIADILIVCDLPTMAIDEVYGRGQLIADRNGLKIDIEAWSYPDSAKNTVKLGKVLKAKDFDIIAPKDAETVKANVIGVIENQAPTRAMIEEMKVSDGLVQGDIDRDICQIALIERHRATGDVINGLVSGFGYSRPCAMASSVAHDAHHMIVVGTSKSDMALAANRLGEVGGGVVIFSQGKELALVEMPIAGLMSDERAEIVAAKADKLVAAMADCGCTLNNAYMQHSLLALVVIPEIRISDQGIIDVRKFEKIDLFV